MLCCWVLLALPTSNSTSENEAKVRVKLVNAVHHKIERRWQTSTWACTTSGRKLIRRAAHKVIRLVQTCALRQPRPALFCAAPLDGSLPRGGNTSTFLCRPHVNHVRGKSLLHAVWPLPPLQCSCQGSGQCAWTTRAQSFCA